MWKASANFSVNILAITSAIVKEADILSKISGRVLSSSNKVDGNKSLTTIRFTFPRNKFSIEKFQEVETVLLYAHDENALYYYAEWIDENSNKNHAQNFILIVDIADDYEYLSRNTFDSKKVKLVSYPNVKLFVIHKDAEVVADNIFSLCLNNAYLKKWYLPFTQPQNSNFDLIEFKKAVLQYMQREIKDNEENLDGLLSMFEALQTGKDGVLRLHRENFLYKYGDTVSYKEALENIFNAVKELEVVSQGHCERIIRLADEYIRCFSADKQKYQEAKKLVCDSLKSTLGAAKTLKEVVDLFTLIDVNEQPDGILRKHRENWVFSYGDTDSYKQMVIEFAKKLKKVPCVDVGSLHAMDHIQQEFQRLKPYFQAQASWDSQLTDDNRSVSARNSVNRISIDF